MLIASVAPRVQGQTRPRRIGFLLEGERSDYVQRFDADALMDRLESFHGHACGGGPMVAVMKAARALGASRATVLRYADSGDKDVRNLATALLMHFERFFTFLREEGVEPTNNSVERALR